jgi:uncharacterized protein YggU (UPF0235/DUF167 family)
LSDGLVRKGSDLLVEIRLTPRADRDRVDGAVTLSDGARVLGMRVRAVPEGGKANAAAAALLAAAAGVPKSSVTVVAGATARRKTLRLAGADAAVEATLSALLSS